MSNMSASSRYKGVPMTNHGPIIASLSTGAAGINSLTTIPFIPQFSLAEHVSISTPITKLSDDVKSEVDQVFEFYDEGQKGYLNKQEFKLAFIALFGYKPSKYQKRQLFPHTNFCCGVIKCRSQICSENKSRLGKSGNLVTKDAFLHIVSEKWKQSDDTDRWREVFNVMDINSKGFLTLDDLKICCSELQSVTQKSDKGSSGPQRVLFKNLEIPSDHVLRKIFDNLDTNKDGRVILGDFILRMKE